ncbi:MAG: DUF3822 family protein [Prevotella sp.]|nr:DUF3822 family protein [Prevotella sp.]
MQEIGNNTIINKPRLTIRISRNTLSFSAVNPDEPGNIIYEPYTVKSGVSIAANLREAFKAIDLLRNGWQRAMILLDGPVLMLPVDTFNDAAADELFKYSMTGHDNDVILSTVLPSLNAVAVYPINKDLKQVIDDHFSDVRYVHVCTPVWNHLYRRSFTGIRNKVYAYFHDRKMEVFCFQQNRFRFTNSFETTLAPDAVYYILNVWKQLALDNKRDELHLIGDLPERDSLVTELRNFIRNVYIINPKAEYNRAPITEIPNLPYDLITYFVKS